MNAANRAILVILFLISMVVCSILLIVPAPVFGLLAGWFGALGHYFGRFATYTAGWAIQLAVGIFLAAVLDFVLILLIVLEVRRPRTRPIRVEKAAGGDVLISASSIADRLRYEIDQLPDVIRVRPKVRARRRGVAVELYVETAAGIDVPEKAERIVAVSRVVIEEKLGLKLARSPKVNLSAVRYPRALATPVAQGAPVSALIAADRLSDEVEEEATGGAEA